MQSYAIATERCRSEEIEITEPQVQAFWPLTERFDDELLEAAVPIGERLYAEAPDSFVKRMRAYWKAWRPG